MKIIMKKYNYRLILIFEKREGRGAELRQNYTLLALQNRDPSPEAVIHGWAAVIHEWAAG